MTPLGRVLVVEDNETHRYVVSSWLRRAGYSVAEAATGAEGLACVGSDIDVVVLDVHLPDMSGFDVCAQIKARHATSSIPVMHVSAIAIDVRSRAEGLDRGADAYLVQPLERDEFLAMVRALSRAHGARRKSARLAGRLSRLAAMTLPVNSADSLMRLLGAAAAGAADVFGEPALVAAESDNGQARALCPGPGAAVVTEALGEPLNATWTAAPRTTDADEVAATSPVLLGGGGVPVRRWYVVPIGDADGTTRAGLAVALPPDVARVREDDAALARQLADAIGVALTNLRAYAQEHRIAVTLQQALLPESLPAGPGLTLAARYLASSEQTSVGGDFYDAFELPTGRLAAVVGDVQGHSLRAATVMAELRFSLRAYLTELHDPGTALSLLNVLLQRGHPEDTATVILLIFDSSRRYVDVANAGHLPALLVTPTSASYIDAGGVLLGVPAPAPEPVRVELPGECSLVLTTDGLIERRDTSIDEGLKELRHAVQAHVTLDPERICDMLVDRFVAPTTEDDIAVLVVHVDPSPGT